MIFELNEGGNVTGLSDFILKYIKGEAGQLMSIGVFLSLILWVYFVSIKNYVISKMRLYSFSIIFVLSCIFYAIPLEGNTPSIEFFNPLQVNGISSYKLGNYTAEYSDDYQFRKDLKIEWEEEQGQNQGKNIIFLLVESWGCGSTEICGKGPTLMPKMDEIARNNLFFPNYYSVLPATSLSVRAIFHSVPFIKPVWDMDIVFGQNMDEDKKKRLLKSSNQLISKNNLLRDLKANGYTTRFVSSTDLVFGMNDAVFTKEANFDEIIFSSSPIFSDITKRYVFNSVPDGVMFDKILGLIKSEKNKFFYLVKTASSHSPFNTPLGDNDMRKAYKYMDNSVADFINGLEKQGFFDNGIVVMFGDHHAWNAEATNVSQDDIKKNGNLFINKVPLVIIDGKHQAEVNNTEFSHASLGVMVQCMELPSCIHNQFNINPLSQDHGYETIFGYDYNKTSYLFVRKNGKEGTIRLNGDESDFINSEFTKDEENEILGYVATFRR